MLNRDNERVRTFAVSASVVVGSEVAKAVAVVVARYTKVVASNTHYVQYYCSSAGIVVVLV